MRYGNSPVHRLSTASSVSKPPHFILTTQWVWYWKDDGGKWLEYGKVTYCDSFNEYEDLATLDRTFLREQMYYS